MTKPQPQFNLSLKKLDPRRIRDDEVVVFIGPRNSGKSFLVRDILYHNRRIPCGIAISPTEEANQAFSDIIPPYYIFKEYTPETVDRVLKRQKDTIAQKNAGDDDIDPRGFLLMDDCLYDKNWIKDQHIREIFMNGRHWKLFYLLTMQAPLGIPPALRGNIDWVFICKTNNFQDRKRLFECYGGVLPNFDIFCQVLDQCTQNYEVLAINLSSKSSDITDQVFWYKAQPRSGFRVGCDSYWAYNDRHYDPRLDQSQDTSSTTSSQTKSLRKVAVTVKKDI